MFANEKAVIWNTKELISFVAQIYFAFLLKEVFINAREICGIHNNNTKTHINSSGFSFNDVRGIYEMNNKRLWIESIHICWLYLITVK